MAKFTHLHVHSHYSLLDGLPKIHDLVQAALQKKMKALALTDHGAMYGAVKFYRACLKAGIRPIIGLEAYVAARRHSQKNARLDRKRYHLVLLAQNYAGFQNLLKLTSIAHLQGFYYKPRIDHELLAKYSQGLICLSGCLQGEIPQSLLAGNLEKAEKIARIYQNIFGSNNFYLELQHHPNIPDQETANRALVKLAKKLKLPLVATNDVHYLEPEDAEAQDILVAIQTKKELRDTNRLSMRGENFSLKSPQIMEKAFCKIPEALESTQAIVRKCNLELELGRTRMPQYSVPEKAPPLTYLKKLCLQGLESRFNIKAQLKNNQIKPISAKSSPKETAEIIQRLKTELQVIEKTNFVSYFLIIADVVNWAKAQNIAVGPGRGSAAGSLVSYLLNITDINPLKYGLLFERFLTEDRIAPPDIDIDFADHRREEVIDYISRRYGQEHVAQIITFGTMGARAVVRDVGRALGYEYIFCDRLAKLIPFGLTLDEALERSWEFRQLYETDPRARKLIDLSRQLEGCARHASTHAAGVVITSEPLAEITALQHASRNDKTVVTQFDMYDAEELGLLKIDILGLRNLSIIEQTLQLIKDRHNKTLGINEIPLDEPKTYELLRQGNTVGIFQLEGEGMRHYLKELKPTDMEDIIAMVSLYRPGPIELIPEFIARKHGQQEVKYPHPDLEPVLKSTYGIMIYQEQLLKVAQKLAGFSLAEADVLRKAVGKKIRSLLQEQKNKFIAGCLKNGYSEKLAQSVWALIEPFDRYGFNAAHATSYAVIAVQTAFLKANYPVEFFTSLLNSRKQDVEKIAFFVEDSNRNGIKVLPPDINESGPDFTPVSSNSIRFGLEAIKNVGKNLVKAIAMERKKNGPFQSVADLVSRLQIRDLNKKSWEALIKAGALSCLEERGKLLGNLDKILRLASDLKKAALNSQVSLFGDVDAGPVVPHLNLEATDPVPLRQKLVWEKELLGLYISGNPLKEHQEILDAQTLPIAQINDSPNKRRRVKIGGTVEGIKKITTKNGAPMLFVKLRDLSDSVEIIVFSDVLEQDPAIWQKGRVVLAKCQLKQRNGEMTLVCEQAEGL